MSRASLSLLFSFALVLGFAGCGGGGDGGLQNNNPGTNDVNVVVAFGDSITAGTSCDCPSYPDRLANLIGKTVRNSGSDGSLASHNVERAQSVINSRQPGFMLILYGINDVIHGDNVNGIVEALYQMVSICKHNNVVPVLATYPQPIRGHTIFAYSTLALNTGIRSLAASEGIKCVDLEAEFNADPALYESDGLHPNDAGTQIVALAFADLF
jgi:acyl-CoA thioesterase I